METDVTFTEAEEDNLYLVDVITSQIDLIYYIAEVELAGLYDQFNEDKIKCISSSFQTIDAAQKALRKKIRELK